MGEIVDNKLLNKKEEIKDYYIKHYLNYSEIAKIYNTSQRTISYILQEVLKIPRIGNSAKKIINLELEIRELAKSGKSINYIANTLNIGRGLLTEYIKENNIYIKPYVPQVKPRNKKLYNKYKNKIQELLDDGYIKYQILQEIPELDSKSLQSCICQNPKFKEQHQDNYNLFMINLKNNSNATKFVQKMREKYYFEDLENEEWVQVKSNNLYYFSNMGRFKRYLPTYDCFRLFELKPCKNGYIDTRFGAMHRLVANAFCDGRSSERKEVNHIDGNKENNKYTNLEWVTPKENMRHAREVLDRKSVV